jgi:hypothetical protein
MVPRICSTWALAAVTLAVAVIASAWAASETATASNAKVFPGNLCVLVSVAELAKVHVSSPCVKVRTATVVSNTPLGAVRIVQYSAVAQSGADHSLRIVVQNPQVPASELAAAKQYLRGLALSNGQLFSRNPWASYYLDTASCANPPTDDCTAGTIKAVVGVYFVQIFLRDTAPFLHPDDPQNPAVDEANDRAQEDTAMTPFEAIGRSVIAGL